MFVKVDFTEEKMRKFRKTAALLLGLALILSALAGCGTKDAAGNEESEEERPVIIESGEFEKETIILLCSAEASSADHEAALLFAEEVSRETGGNVAVTVESAVKTDEETAFERVMGGGVPFALVYPDDLHVRELLAENSIYYYNCMVLFQSGEEAGSSFEKVLVVNNDYWNGCFDGLKSIFQKAANRFVSES